MSITWNRAAVARSLGVANDDDAVIDAWLQEFSAPDADLALTHYGPDGMVEREDGSLELSVSSVAEEVERILLTHRLGADAADEREDDELDDDEREVKRLLAAHAERNKRHP